MVIKNSVNEEITSFDDAENISMETLLKEYAPLEDILLGKNLEVTIIEENSEGFMVNLGMKSDAIIPKSEFVEGNIPNELKVGATVKVKLVNNRNRQVLSYKAVAEEKNWINLEEIYKQGKYVTGRVMNSTKGGFFVDVFEEKAFLPISQTDIHFIKDTNEYIGQTYDFLIIEFDKIKRNIVLSRRNILQKAKDLAKAEALSKIEENQIIDGKVTNITRYGAFVDIGGVEGLLHIGEIVWYRVNNIQDLLHVGKQIRVQVLKVYKDAGKISLSMKNLAPHPWDNIDEKFPIGLITRAIVRSIVDSGVLVELEPGVEGLLRSCEYAWSNSETLIKKELKKRQSIEVKIINVDKENKKIELSVKQIHTNPWDSAFANYTPGKKVKGIVTNIMPFGAFVKLKEGIEGLVHISDFSWTKVIKNPEEILKKGNEVEVVILEVNPQNERISLSLKHIKENPLRKYRAGTVVIGKVVKILDHGVLIELEPGVNAFIKNNDIFSLSGEQTQSLAKDGQVIEAKIIRVDLKNRKIDASVRKLELDRERDLIKQYSNQNVIVTLGETLSED